MKRSEPLTRQRIETACRLCRTTRQGADLLGCSPGSFLRRVKQLGIAWDGLKPKKSRT